MPLIAEVSKEKTSADAARISDDFKQTLRTSFLPNFFKTLAHAPAVMEGTWHAYRGTCRTGSVPASLKEMIFAAISTARGCEYCEAAHLAFAKVDGVPSETIETLVKGFLGLPPGRTRDVLYFAIKCAMRPVTLTEEDYQGLRNHGFSTAEIVEIVGACAFAMYATTVADAFRVQVDPEFREILSPMVV